jgi:hypothetical protein
VEYKTKTSLSVSAAPSPALADDLLLGVGSIAEFIYGNDSQKNRRRVYHLHATGQLPTFRMGNRVSARKYRLVRHVEELEDARAA